MAREFTTIGVVGLGTMGAGIAEVFARSGYAVIGVEQTAEQLDVGRAHVDQSTARALRRGRLTESERQIIFERLTLTTELSDIAECDLVVEAVVERLDVKVAIFKQLDDIVRPDAVLATNTSSLSVTDISAATAVPGRVIGMHFFNPAPVQKLVEVIRTVSTEPDVVTDVLGLARRLGKHPVAADDRAGFIANALLFGYLNHAVSMYESRYATREDIDTAMRTACGYPMGPLALLDLIGLDTAHSILVTMYRQGRDRLHAPAPLLEHLVTAGRLGRKTSHGFYTYQAAHSSAVVVDRDTPPTDVAPVAHRAVSRVGVVGSSPSAVGIVEMFANADFDTVGVTGSSDLGQLAHVDLVIEAVADDLVAKRELLEALDDICKPGAIIATTTSLLPVMQLAAATRRPGDVLGMHFVGPATVPTLVEVVSTIATSSEVAETVRAVCAVIGTESVACGDRAGFIVNALVVPYLNNAVRMLEARYAGTDDIDAAMKEGCALPMGPFEVLDVVGTDVALALQHAIFSQFPEPGYAPALLLQQRVTAGHLGRTSGRGFRDHTPG